MVSTNKGGLAPAARFATAPPLTKGGLAPAARFATAPPPPSAGSLRSRRSAWRFDPSGTMIAHRSGKRWLGIAALAVSTSACNGLFYQPSREVLGEVNQRAEVVSFRSADGTLLRGFWLHSESGGCKAAFVHFH